MHGGSVRRRSDGPGRGASSSSASRRREARARRPPAAGAEHAARGRRRTRPGPRRVLVVDDNADAARGLARLLAASGHEARIAHDGPRPSRPPATFRPDVVLLDIGLPGMDGYEVAARLRGEGWASDAVIIAITGYGQDDDRRRSREAGFDHHLVKPVDHDALLALLSTPGGVV